MKGVSSVYTPGKGCESDSHPISPSHRDAALRAHLAMAGHEATVELLLESGYTPTEADAAILAVKVAQ